jgi:CheY-like chemotaxis protein
MSAATPLHLLLVEDNPAHAELVRRTLEHHETPVIIDHVIDGEAALDYLFQRGAYGAALRPTVILLDLRLPKIDGLEVLRTIKTSPGLQKIPVVVLSTSKAEEDVAKAYTHHANSYLVKPVDFDRFVQMMRDLGLYWLVWNQEANGRH